MAESYRVVEAYLDEVCAQVRCRKAHTALREELRGHIEERIEGALAQGMDAEEAAQQAVMQMGDSVLVGRQLDLSHRPRVDWRLLVLVALLAAVGAALMAVCGREYGQAYFQNPGFLTIRFTVYLCIGFGAMLGLMFLDYSKLQIHPMLYYAAAIVLLVLTYATGVYQSGRPYLNLGLFQISPIYLMVPLFIVAFAGLITNYRGGGAMCLIKLIAVGVGSILMLLAYPSLAGALLLIICYALMLTVAVAKGNFRGRRGVILGTLYGGGVLLALLGLCLVFGLNQPYRFMRFTSFLNFGAAEPTGVGYLYAISHQWLSASELFGPAQGMAQPLVQSLPAAHTDYAFVSIIATFGWAAGVGVAVLAAAFVGRIAQVGYQSKSRFGSMLCLGIGTMLAAEFLLCMLTSLGLLPMLSIGMPFLSYGGTEYVIHLAMVGLVLSVRRYHNLVNSGGPTEGKPRERFVRYEDGKLIVHFRWN